MSSLISDMQQLHRGELKTCRFYFLNSAVKHWPILIIFGMQHRKETRHERL